MSVLVTWKHRLRFDATSLERSRNFVGSGSHFSLTRSLPHSKISVSTLTWTSIRTRKQTNFVEMLCTQSRQNVTKKHFFARNFFLNGSFFKAVVSPSNLVFGWQDVLCWQHLIQKRSYERTRQPSDPFPHTQKILSATFCRCFPPCVAITHHYIFAHSRVHKSPRIIHESEGRERIWKLLTFEEDSRVPWGPRNRPWFQSTLVFSDTPPPNLVVQQQFLFLV